MKSILELAETTTGTTGIDKITPEVWSKEVEQQAQALRVARQFVKVNTDLMNRPGDRVHVLKGVKLTVADDVQSGLTEGDLITPTALDDYNSVILTPAPYYAAVRISEDVIEEVSPDIIKDANQQIAEVLAQKEDQLILEALGNASGIAVLYGGDATSDATLEAGDVLTTDLIANAITELRKNNYNADVLFIHPIQENVLLKDSQFVNASEYGSNEVVMNGEIGKYLGVKIISTTNVVAKTTADGWGADGHICLMIDSKHAGVLAVKQPITIRSVFQVERNAHLIVGRIKIAADALMPEAICAIHVTDA